MGNEIRENRNRKENHHSFLLNTVLHVLECISLVIIFYLTIVRRYRARARQIGELLWKQKRAGVYQRGRPID